MIVVSKKLKSVSFLTLIVLIFSCVLTLKFTGAHAVFYGYNLRRLPIYSVETSEKKISISFDCAWGVDYTDKLLAIMKTENVKCTFFATEFWVKKYPDYVKKISELGHEWGTHSATHPYMSKLDKKTIISELSSSSKAIEDITGKKVELFRPPYGDYNDRLIETATELNLFTIQWSIDSLDWKDLSASQIKSRVVSKAKNGAIVLFHNQGLHTAEALGGIITELKSAGYEFVPIGELIYKSDYQMLPDGAQRKLS